WPTQLSRSSPPLSTRIVFRHPPQPETNPNTTEMTALIKNATRYCAIGSIGGLNSVLRETLGTQARLHPWKSLSGPRSHSTRERSPLSGRPAFERRPPSPLLTTPKHGHQLPSQV